MVKFSLVYQAAPQSLPMCLRLLLRLQLCLPAGSAGTAAAGAAGICVLRMGPLLLLQLLLLGAFLTLLDTLSACRVGGRHPALP